MPSEQPLTEGQKVELGIAEAQFAGLGNAGLPLAAVGLFVLAGIFQVLLEPILRQMCGGALGGVGGFMLARGFCKNSLSEKPAACHSERRPSSQYASR